MDKLETDQNSSNSNETQAASGKTTTGGESLDDLFSTLKNQINTTDWLEKNTAEKWEKDNPEFAQQYREAANKKT